MKRLIAMLLVLVMCLSLVACGGSDAPATNEPAKENTANNETAKEDAAKSEPSKAEPVEIVFWHNRGGKAGETLEAIIAEFNKTNTEGITITPVYQSDSVSALKTVLQAKDTESMPDMIQIFAGDVEYMSTVKYVVPISDMIAKDSSYDAEILNSLLTTYTYNGTLYSMPFHASTMGFFWNKTAFAEAGLDPETPPTTIAEMAEMAEKLLKVDASGAVSQYAITLAISNTYLNHWIGGQGEYSFIGNNEAGRAGRMTEVTFDKDGTMAALLTEWKKVLDTGAVQSIESGNQAREEFCAGLSAMLCSSNSALGTVENMSKEMGFEFGVAPLPKVNATDAGSVCPGGSSVYILNKESDAKIQAAWSFIKHWVAPEQQYAFCSVTGTIPVSAATMEYGPMKDYIAAHPGFMPFFAALNNSNPKVQEHLAPTQQEFTTIFMEVGQKFANGEVTVDEAVAEMAQRCNTALADFNEANPIG